MRIQTILLAGICAALLVGDADADSSRQKTETRCGWFENSSPQNASLTDRDGEWLIGMQGGHQADGDWPNFKASQWVNTNRSYGYGCACLKVLADQRTREITRISATHALALGVCRKDPALKEPAP